MKLWKSVCMTVYFLTIPLLAAAFCAQSVCESTVTEIFIERAVSGRVLDDVFRAYPDASTDQLKAAEDYVRGNPYLKKITGVYLKAIGDLAQNEPRGGTGVLSTQAGILDREDSRKVSGYIEAAGGEIYDYIVGYFPVELSDSGREELRRGISEHMETVRAIIERACVNMLQGMTGEMGMVLKAYALISSGAAKVLLCALLAGCIAGIFLTDRPDRENRTNRQKKVGRAGRTGTLWMRDIGILNTVWGVLLILMPYLGSGLVWTVTNRVLGRTSDIDVKPILICGVVVLATGVILLGVWKLFLREQRARGM